LPHHYNQTSELIKAIRELDNWREPKTAIN
jgi:hypothetical protein